MRGSIYVSAVSCLLLSLVQRGIPQEDEPVASEVMCPALTPQSLTMSCLAAKNEQMTTVFEKVPCNSAPAGSSVSLKWRKNIVKASKGGLELECNSSGQWSKKKTIIGKPGYILVPGIGAYKLYKEKTMWILASFICLKDGGHIAIIDSENELNVLKKLLQGIVSSTNAVFNGIHIGIHDMFTEGTYETVLGDPFQPTPYLQWKKGEPNNYNNEEDCTAFTLNTFELFDIQCGKAHDMAFVCELLQMQ